MTHTLLQAKEDVAREALLVDAERLWRSPGGAAAAGFHLLHLAGALDRLFTYARGEVLSDAQKSALRAEAQPRPDLDGAALAAGVGEAVDRAMAQLRSTDPASLTDARTVGRSGSPSTVIGLLVHAAEHTTRHVGQFVTTLRISGDSVT